ncbi:hypothetical protein N826_06075 [Skermanella aerolata KACC 11604]|nr:hypothetical protein N826_06075 [Skermanella aerolata KACC 11604]
MCGQNPLTILQHPCLALAVCSIPFRSAAHALSVGCHRALANLGDQAIKGYLMALLSSFNDWVKLTVARAQIDETSVITEVNQRRRHLLERRHARRFLVMGIGRIC